MIPRAGFSLLPMARVSSPPAPFGLAAFLCVLVTPGRGRSFPADRVRTKGGARLRAVVQPHPLEAGGVSF